MRLRPEPLCRRCGCASGRHIHYRAGIDCGTCGRERCPSYQRPSILARWFA